VLALTAKNGGLGIANPVLATPFARDDSKQITAQLVSGLIYSQKELVIDKEEQKFIKVNLKNKRTARELRKHEQLLARLPEKSRERRALELAVLPSASLVFTTRPLAKYGLAIPSKRDFRDALRLHFGLPIERLPTECRCGQPYSLDHSQICKVGGFIHMRHDEPAKLFAKTCSIVFKDVEREPALEELEGEHMRLKSANVQDDARSDVRAMGFWGNKQNAFFDFKVVYPYAKSYLSQKPKAILQSAANGKKREYEQRVNDVEGGSFTPMIMLSNGAVGSQMVIAIKHLAARVAEKTKQKYAQVVGVLRCQFAFAMMRAALVCLRGSRSRRSYVVPDNPLGVLGLAACELGVL
jgi:hypothetical protein